MQPKAFSPKIPFAVTTPAPPVIDTDAAAYITRLAAVGYTVNATEQSAINDFYKAIKGETDPALNVFSDTLDMKPYIGGTAAAHAIDGAIHAGTVDATFFGGFTHNANGITGNGINAYYTFNFIPSAKFSGDNRTYINYNRTNSAGGFALFGAVNGSFLGDTCYPLLAGLLYYSLSNGTSAGQAETTTNALYIFTRTGATTERLYKNGSLYYIKDNAVSVSINIDMFRMARNFAGAGDRYAPYNFCFDMTINRGLTATEAGLLSTAINNLQTALGRNIY
jgi:hypothetical protein